MPLDRLMQTLHFPDEAVSEIARHELKNPAMAALAKRYFDGNLRFDDALVMIAITKKGSTPIEIANLLFILHCAERLTEVYRSLGLPDSVLRDTLDDIRVKLFECKKVKGIWGNFVPFWYAGFFELRRFGLGRLQYDFHPYEWGEFSDSGITIDQNTTVYSCHIPSNGLPLNRENVQNSLKMAHAFFRENLQNGILPVVCHSWLLRPSLAECLSEKSNILSFASLFRLVRIDNAIGFPDAWRVFGKHYTDANAEYPTETAMQRAILSYLRSGHHIGSACGILLFDGEKIL